MLNIRYEFEEINRNLIIFSFKLLNTISDNLNKKCIYEDIYMNLGEQDDLKVARFICQDLSNISIDNIVINFFERIDCGKALFFFKLHKNIPFYSDFISNSKIGFRYSAGHSFIVHAYEMLFYFDFIFGNENNNKIIGGSND